MTNNKKDIIITISIILLFIIGSLIGITINNHNKEFIIKDYGITYGTFYSFDKVGAENTPYLTYIYTINDISYQRSIIPNKNPYYCEHNNCKGKKWRVIYSKKKPSKSLIDLSIELFQIDSLTKINFKNFE